VAFDRNFSSKMRDFSRLQAVTHTVKVIVSQKWCKTDTLKVFQKQFDEHFCNMLHVAWSLGDS